MSLIDDFMSRYVKEYDFYNQAAQLAAESLERNLRTSGIRCIVTHRAKDISRLADKCRQRAAKGDYGKIQDIYDDIADLAGVRVALYFPGEQEQVDKIVNRLFHLLEPKKEFPAASHVNHGKRFSGYSAVHYRVHLNEQELSDADKRYAKARVEIQVASVLMHAWSEVEHDLIYKPLEGDLSGQELQILDQLNGLVLAGELALEMLQKAGEVRVTSAGRSFLNHYELAAHLLSQANGRLGEPVEDSGLGRVDLLYSFLAELKFDTASLLQPFLESLHGNLEERPLAEQVIDAILAADTSRYSVFDSIRMRMGGAKEPGGPDRGDRHHELIGRFMIEWAEFEGIIRSVAPLDKSDAALVPLTRLLRGFPDLDAATRLEIDNLRRIRNILVHGGRVQGSAFLVEALERLEAVTARLKFFEVGETSK
ncbi:GTP pyrophosphokinase family protein [Streptomyces sp. NPDC058690]|uniref:GTP pyrophosphokinase n=1 Tax=Streptomyces sp. NPDC058690 TaxID=3346600 RepID=UPI00365243F5